MKDLVIGTSNFNQNYGLSNKKLKITEIQKILNLAKKNKIKYIDTALDYNLSSSLIKKISFKKFKIITKFKLPKNGKKNFVNNLENLLIMEIKKFNIQKFHAILIHNSNDLSSIYGKQIIKVLRSLKKKNFIKYVGLSIYDFNEIKKIPNSFKVDLVQVPINIFDQRFLSKKILKFFENNKIKLQARSVFLQGGLLNKSKKMKKLGKYQDNFAKNCKENLTDPLTASLSFIKNLDQFKYINIGIDNVKQLKMIIKSWNNPIFLNFNDFKIKNLNITDPRKWK